MACVINYNGVEYTEAEFLALLANGELDNLIKSGDFVPPTPPKEPKESRGKSDTPERRTSNLFETTSNNKSLEATTKDIDKADWEYDVKTRDSDQKAALEYIESKGVEEVYSELIEDRVDKNKLSDAQIVRVSALIFGSLNRAKSTAIKNNDIEVADLINSKVLALVPVIQKLAQNLGKGVDAFKAFQLDFSDPYIAVYNIQKAVNEYNEKQKEKQKGNAGRKAKNIAKDVAKAKKQISRAIALDLDEEVFGSITKGVQKGASEETKKKVSDFFDKLKIKGNNGQVLGVIVPITPKMYNSFISAVEKLVIGGLNLSAAMQKASAEMIKSKEVTPKEATEIRKKFNEEVYGQRKSTKSPERIELEEATKKYNEAESLRKELEKERNKIEKLREKEKQKVLDNAEKIALQMAQSKANDLAKQEEKAMIEAKKASDKIASDKIELEKELEKERQRIKDLREKEEQAQRDRIEAVALQRAKAELKEAELRAKELEKKISDLTKDIVNNNEELVSEIIDDYLEMEANGQTDNQKLIDLVKEKLGVDEAKAKEIATKITKEVATKIREKLSKKYEIKEPKSKKKNENGKEIDPVIELANASKLGAITPEALMDFLKDKYNLKELTLEDTTKIQDLAIQISEATTPNRKAALLKQMGEIITNIGGNKVYELLRDIWYFNRLSSVWLFIGGTGDTNVTYNLIQLANIKYEQPITSFLNSLGRGIKKIKDAKSFSKIDVFALIKSVALDTALGAASAISQNIITESEQKSFNNFAEIIKNSKFLAESVQYFKTVFNEGSGSFGEYDSPFQSGSKKEFSLGDWVSIFKKAENGDIDSRNLIAKYTAIGVDGLINGTQRILSAQDLFFQRILANWWKPVLLRDFYSKEGFKGEELEQKIANDLLNTKIEYENAKSKALEIFMKEDIKIEPIVSNNQTKYVIREKGKLVNKQFDSQEDAETYAEEELSIKSNAYKNDVIYFMQQKIDSEVLKAMGRIAQSDILSGAPQGGAAYIFKKLTELSRSLDKASKTLNDFADSLDDTTLEELKDLLKAKDIESVKVLMKKAFAAAAKSIAFIASTIPNMWAFIKVALNSVRNFSSYLPIGLWRWGMSFFVDKKGFARTATGFKYDYKMTDTERNQILAKAILGGIVTSAFLASAKALLGILDKPDDDDDKKKADEKFQEWYFKKTGQKIPNEIKSYYKSLRKGDIIGSLMWMKPSQKEFYEKTGLFPEMSIFDGYDEDGQPLFTSIKLDPKYALAVLFSTYNMVNTLADEKERPNAALAAGLTPLYMYQEMSIGQGGLGVLFSNRSTEDIIKKEIELTMISQLEIGSNSLITNSLKYIDQKKRQQESFFKIMEEEETLSGGLERWALNRVTPVYASYHAATKAYLAYDMFGNEQFSIPAMSQGMVSGKIARYLKSGKNEDSKKLFQWLDMNGYNKMYRNADVLPILDVNGEKIEVKTKDVRKYQAPAAKLAEKEILKRLVYLQSVHDTKGETAFKTAIDEIFKRNFLLQYMEGEGQITKESRERIDKATEKDFEEKDKQLKDTIKDEQKADVKLSSTDIEERDAIRKQSKKELFLISVMDSQTAYKSLENKYIYLKHLKKIKAINHDEYRYLKKHYKL